MDIVAEVAKDKVHSADLSILLESYSNKVKVLSLDCFDTLLWRRTATPIDVFYDLQHKPSFKAIGMTPLMRIHAEGNARTRQFIQHTSTEVSLRDIYLTHSPSLTENQLQSLAEDELAAEIETCYGFPPIIELIRHAHSKGLKIVIVSDTYLKQNQLHHLLSSVLPKDVMSMIEMIFCSNEYGVSKINGLFEHVLKKINHPAQSILHIGDNPVADLAAAKNMHLHAFQLIHHDDQVNELLRMQTTAASCMDSTIRHKRALNNSFRGILASAQLSTDRPEQFIGYAAMGPILYAFAQFLSDEIKQLKLDGKKPKVFFLMRDAYLPMQAATALLGEPLGKPIQISRFASFAASFRTADDVDQYLSKIITGNRFAEMAKQLLLPEAVGKQLIQEASKAPEPAYEFRQLIHQKHILDIIFKQSAAYRVRLLRYIKNETEIEPGETLVFVDLGYSGTTQQQLEPILREEMGIEVAGRYLLSVAVPNWKVTRKGLLDPAWCDGRAMHTLIAYISLLEQLCTSCEKSVIDYDKNGKPIYNDFHLSQEQKNNLDRIQSECLRFILDAKKFFSISQTAVSTVELQDAALSGLTRLLFLPTKNEINYLKSFEFDLNLATKDVFSMIDFDKGLAGLRRRGLFSHFMEKNIKSYRTNTPAELRSAGLELVISLLTHHRFSLDVGIKEMTFQKEKLDAIIINGNQTSQVSLEALLTYDGYFSVWVPVGNGNLKIGILFGKKYQWLQFESAELIASHTFLTNIESQGTEEGWQCLQFEKMTDHGSKLFECLSDSSFTLISSKPKPGNQNYILRLVFRPLVRNTTP